MRMGKTAVISGASSGIGRAVCEALLRQGYDVVGLARDFAKFPCRHPQFTAHSVDLSALVSLPARLKRVAETCADAEALICCAGRGQFGHLEEFSYEQIRELIDLNFTAQAYLARTFLPHMKRAGRGDLVFMGSEAGLRGSRRGSVYCASKFALRGFAQALREECAASGIRVTIINPGMVLTPFFDDLDFGPGPEPANYVLPEDIADLVTSILSTRSGTVFDEVDVSPLKRVVDFRKKRGKE
ncbi:MAG: short-chain dehydrogenase [Gemmatimonadetes bacterium]|nr:short-chain dehydrogenase [Gemmatimonadota bacterium]